MIVALGKFLDNVASDHSWAHTINMNHVDDHKQLLWNQVVWHFEAIYFKDANLKKCTYSLF